MLIRRDLVIEEGGVGLGGKRLLSVELERDRVRLKRQLNNVWSCYHTYPSLLLISSCLLRLFSTYLSIN